MTTTLRRPLRLVLVALAALALVAGLAACGSDSESSDEATTDTTAASGSSDTTAAAGDVVSKYGARLGRTETVPVSSMRFVPDRMEGGVAAAAGLIGLGAYLLSQHSITNLRKKLASLQASERPFT